MPVAATAHTPEGAVAFAKFFIQTIDWGYATTSSAYMKHYFQTGCTQCKNVQTFLDSARKAHEHYVGSRVTIKGASPAAGSTDNVVELRVDLTSWELVDTANNFKSADVAYNDFRETVRLSWTHTGWTTEELSGSK